MTSEWWSGPRGSEFAHGVVSDADSDGSDVILWVRDHIFPEGHDRPERLRAPSERCFAVLRGALTAVLEPGYFDLDSRSESVHSLRYRYNQYPSDVERIHFFDQRIDKGVFYDYLNGVRHTSGLEDAYMGYIVVRPGPTPPIGRTFLRVPNEPIGRGRTLRSRVRTGVSEELTFFGLPLSVFGVPFVQQDGQILACAHAVAWMCHFTAVLRGLITRHATGDLHSLVPAQDLAPFRPFPSPGLTDVQLTRLFDHLDLPADRIGLGELHEMREPAWYDRPSIHADPVRHDWYRENFTTTVCRYLNSGLPVALAIGSHVFLAIGYLRSGDEPEGSPYRFGDGSRITRLILHDDLEGPYVLRDVDELLSPTHQQDSIIVPLPKGLWMSGRDAESGGAELFASMVEKIAADLRSLDQPVDPEVAEILEATSETAALIRDRSLAVRSYAITSSDYKASFMARCNDEVARRIVMTARMPRYVWVVEILNRADRMSRTADSDRAPVLGEVVIDGSIASTEQFAAIILHAPGFIIYDDKTLQVEYLRRCGRGQYDTGRWSGLKMWSRNPISRFKTAGT